jgi:tight adherence protein C
VNAIKQFFEQWSTNPENAQWLISGGIGIASFLFALAVLLLISNIYDPLRRRVRSVATANGSGPQRKATGLARAMEPLQQYAVPKKTESRSEMQTKLIMAGYRSRTAVSTYYGLKLVFSLSLFSLVVIGAWLHPRFTMIEVVYGALMAGFAGLVVPGIILSHLVDKRQRRLLNSFPDALDLLVTCTEAGLGLNAALDRVSDELSLSHPDLADELGLVNAETRAGVERTGALRNLAERTGLQDIRGLVSLLTQSLKFGTSVADTLRVYSEEFRDKRMQRAEEAAAKVGTKMIFPLVLCLFPSFFVVAIGPAIIGVLRALQGLGIE